MTTELIARPDIANLCLLLGRAFSSPQSFEPGDPQLLREMASAGLPPAAVASALALAEEWEHAMNDVEAVLLAYSRLFIGPFEIQASPYASHYLDPNQRLMGEISVWVAEAYADADLGPAKGPHEAPDHIALEWEFLYYLGYQAISLEDSDWSVRAQSFVDEHMSKWVPPLAEAILGAETHPFYHALARFTLHFMQFIGSESS